jgi:hypothetical protein
MNRKHYQWAIVLAGVQISSVAASLAALYSDAHAPRPCHESTAQKQYYRKGPDGAIELGCEGTKSLAKATEVA